MVAICFLIKINGVIPHMVCLTIVLKCFWIYSEHRLPLNDSSASAHETYKHNWHKLDQKQLWVSSRPENNGLLFTNFCAYSRGSGVTFDQKLMFRSYESLHRQNRKKTRNQNWLPPYPFSRGEYRWIQPFFERKKSRGN